MRLLKPYWVNHDDFQIFSIDIHPDDTRFVTGGQGQDNIGRITIWNFAPILNEKVAKNEKIPKLLCQLDHHNGCVNSVRWSNSGKYLASGGDDRIIMVWKLISSNMNAAPMNSAFGKTNYEVWKNVAKLVGHTGDVLDINWSPDDKYLASASVDNTVVVWNAHSFPSLTAVLKGHNSLVKGVTWDPVGKYIATQSDDKSLIIWRTSDWQMEHVVKDPYQECGGTTHVLRLGWSPDGLYLVSAHAMNAGGPTAQIIERDGWKTDKDFVGHRKAICCVRFNKNILQLGKNRCCYVAIGSRDHTVSVWTTALRRPVVVLTDLFDNTVMDISWSSCGTIMLCCSSDGTIGIVQFDPIEIGKPISPEEKASLYSRYYGKNIMSNYEVIEDVDVFLAKKNIEEDLQISLQTNSKNDNISQIQEQSQDSILLQQYNLSSNEALIKGPTDRQIETKTADGKRRITPKFIPPPQLVANNSNNNNENNTNIQNNNINGNNNDKSGIEENEGAQEIDQNSKSEEDKNKEQASSNKNLSPKKNDELTERSESIRVAVESLPEINGGCNKREFPKSITDNNVDNSNNQDNSKKMKLEDQSDIFNQENLNQNQSHPISVNNALKARIAPLSLPDTVSLNLNNNDNNTKQPKKYITLTSSKTRDEINEAASNILQPQQSFALKCITTAAAPAAVAKSGHSGSTKLNPLKLESSKILRVNTNDGGYVLRVDNSNVLKCEHQKSSLFGLNWSVSTDFPFCFLTGSATEIIAVCEDSSVHVFNLKGRYCFPPLILTSVPNIVQFSSNFLFILTVKARIFLWNISTKKCLIKDESIVHLLNQPTSSSNPLHHDSGKNTVVLNVKITSKGVPVLELSNGKKFMYHYDMSTWMSFVYPGGMVATDSVLDFSTSVISNAFQNDPKILTQAKLRFSVAQEFNNAPEVKNSLIIFARTLAEFDLEQELNTLCRDLLGPARLAFGNTSWVPEICGLPKRLLLQEILNDLLRKGLRWQRLYSEFNDQLKKIEQNSAFEKELERESN